jgi:hypothetical protein
VEEKINGATDWGSLNKDIGWEDSGGDQCGHRCYFYPADSWMETRHPSMTLIFAVPLPLPGLYLDKSEQNLSD